MGSSDQFLSELSGEPYRPAPAVRANARPRRSADIEADEETFLRTRRRVPVRKGLLPDWAKTRWGGLALGAGILALLGGLAAAAFGIHTFLQQDPRFRIDSSSSIQTMGNSQLSRADLLSVFGSDIGRNIFYVPLAQRRAELEQIPWVEHATVMRLLPDQLRVAVTERTPIAFVRLGSKISLVDGEGVLLDMAPSLLAAKHFNFPVVTGINPTDPLSTRAPRMHLYQRFIQALDSAGDSVSNQLSEIDLSDPEDVRATITEKNHEFLLHFGDDNFLARYRNYVAHISEWEQQYPNLASIDLRYDDQVVLKMANSPAPPNAATPAPAEPSSKAPPKAAATPSKSRAKRPAAHHSKAVRKESR